jgi:beta-phosphoglucomutase-like phosphatase (HAD superfamily)
MALRFSLDEPFGALIFDCDGTLVDTARAHLAAYNAVLAKTREEMSWQWYQSRLGMPAHELLLELFEERQLELAIEEAVAGHARAYQASFDQMREITAVAEVARAYHGKVPMAVASNGIRVNVLGSLRGAGLLHLFDAVVAVDEVAQGKPEPDLYLEAARRLDVAPEDCIVFEDTPEGLEAAHRAGMRTRDVTRIAS